MVGITFSLHGETNLCNNIPIIVVRNASNNNTSHISLLDECIVDQTHAAQTKTTIPQHSRSLSLSALCYTVDYSYKHDTNLDVLSLVVSEEDFEDLVVPELNSNRLV